jgi:hypothetical protein
MMKTAKAEKESPEAAAKRQREEVRADKANLAATQGVLDGLTRRYSRRFGLVKQGSQPTIVGGLDQLAGAAAAGGGDNGFTGGFVYGGGGRGRSAGESSKSLFAEMF